MIKPCDCQHKYQDERYGQGNRVHNEMKKEGKSTGWRCTVCGKKKTS